MFNSKLQTNEIINLFETMSPEILAVDLTVNNSGLIDGTRVGVNSNPVNFYEMNPNVSTNPEENVYYRVTFKRPEHTYVIMRGLGGNCDFGGGYAIKQ
jgi:hypothetical protein